MTSTSRYAGHIMPTCHDRIGHLGRCREYAFLEHLHSVAPGVAAKVKRDATMTTGAAWASADAGPNRILRWVMLLSDEELLTYGIDMGALSLGTQAKLRDKGASYEECMNVALYLAWSVYGTRGAPDPVGTSEMLLFSLFGEISPTLCLICKRELHFSAFASARRGRALIETAHGDPRSHHASNVGFAHRECNIAQGDKSLVDFYDWIGSILENVERVGVYNSTGSPSNVDVSDER